MQDASACANIPQCGDCVVHCNCGGAPSCLGSNTTLRCLGENDAVRNLPPASLPNGQFPFGVCDSSTAAGTVGLVAPDHCGLNLCCPENPFVPAGCQNELDARLGLTGQCQAMVDSGSFSCEQSFCPTCGKLAGQCDHLCGYGLCSVCGDCFRSARLAAGQPEPCDDGNAEDGDGCSSSCLVEDGWTCTKEAVLLPDAALGGVQRQTTVDRCTTCTDSPVAWTDSQGYTCEDYEMFAACDSNSLSSDALVLGGRLRMTPEYFQYQFLYNTDISPGKPLKMLVSVAAANDAHIFLGKPGEYGFEIVVGGWNNGQSVLRTQPTLQTLGNYYGALLDPSEMQTFWVYYAWDGNLSVGRGEVFWEMGFLHGSYLTTNLVSMRSWYDSVSQVSLLNEVHISTGWGAVGSWDVRLVDGFAGMTLGDLADGSGVDATSACCACGGGVSGRPCEQRVNGQLPFQARGDVAGSTEGSRRLSGLGGFASDPLLLGMPGTDGFSLSLNFTSCAVTQQSDPSGDWCILEVVVAPGMAKNRVITPLANVWTQMLDPGCRIMDHHQVGSGYIWQATGCNMTAGALYVLALHLTTSQGDVLLLMDLQIPGKPTYTPSSVVFSDSDVRRGYLLGEVTIEGAEDESNILQYRAYYGRSNDTRVNFLSDERAAGIGWVNTYADGGLRNGYNNECLYGDCSWKMQLSKTAGNGRPYNQYLIRHEHTGKCLCYANAVLSQNECYANLLTVDSPVAYKYLPSGNGALIDRNNEFYKTVWYRDIGDRATKTVESVLAIMQQVCDDFGPCVGVLIAETNFDGIILLDRTYGTEEYPGLWPPEVHPLLLAAGAEEAWNAFADSQALSPANPTRTSLDVLNDPMWQPWLAFIKEKKDPDCLWSIQDRIFNSTVESRLKSSASADCLCQVPTETTKVGEDGEEVPVTDPSVHKPHIGKFCDAMWMDFTIDGKEVRSSGYCEWELYPEVPTSSAVLSFDAAQNLTSGSTEQGSVEWSSMEAPAWLLNGEGHFELNPKKLVGSEYTMAAWIKVPYFEAANASDAGQVRIFDAMGVSGDSEPCLQLSQRLELDGRPPFCTGDFLCNGTDLFRCCMAPTSPLMTTTTTTATRGVNETEMEYEECDCSCAINMTEEVEDELGTPLSRKNMWAVGMRACDSEAAWDSGADMSVPRHGSEWLLLVAVGRGDMEGRGTTTFYSSEALGPEVIRYTQSFGCATPGCATSLIFRDIPRDPARTCALEVDVYVTDYTNDQHHVNPEVVEYITVRGGAPEVSRTVREYCHPDGSNQLDRLYKCVHKENLDAWILSRQSDRAVRIDMKISDFVDMYPKDGLLLNGIATIACARVALPGRRLPRSGSIHVVGEAPRTCAGSVLQAVGGTAGMAVDGSMPDTYISQAWMWDRALNDEELMALHLGTRTRYHRDYQINLQNVQVVRPGAEIKASGIMQCSQPGCSASVEVSGLPTNADARCFLTFGIAMTDFSGPEEVVEYIAIDDYNVVERCWPQVDGDPNNMYYCADKLDVSQAALRGSFLKDGTALVTAKLSSEVDILEFRFQNRWMLYAEVEILCVGGVVSNDPLPDMAVKIEPEVTHILAAAANVQGEGGKASLRFYDKSNGFTVQPVIGDSSTAAVRVDAEAMYPEGQFWAFVVNRSVAAALTIEDIHGGAYSTDVICENPQRAQGRSTFEDFRSDPFLVQCPFEPGIDYVLVVYLDAAEPPYGGGVRVNLPFVGRFPDVVSQVPLLRPRALEFVDTESLVGRVFGTLTITSAASEVNFTHYHVYYGFFSRRWPEGTEPFAIIPVTGAYQYSVQVNTQLLPDVNTFLVFCKNAYGEAEQSRQIGILDSSMVLLEEPIISPSYQNGMLYLDVSTRIAGTGARVDVAVVPKGMESLAESSFNYRQLNFGPLTASAMCLEANIQQDEAVQSKAIGPCDLVPAAEYTVIVHVAIRFGCPCVDPCFCTGELNFRSQAASGGGLEASPTGHIILPDRVPPTLTLHDCDANCNLDSRIKITGHIQDTGSSYPVLTMCAACAPPYNPSTDPAPQPTDPPRTCLRNGDAEAHRGWRIRIPQGHACPDRSQINIAEAEFYEVSPLEQSGRKVEPAGYVAKVPEIPGAVKDAAFDGSLASKYLMDTISDAWLAIDMGLTQKAAILRFRGHWDIDCVPSKVVLEWTDDFISWTERMAAEETATNQEFTAFTDLYVSPNAENWTNGAFYQVAYVAESENSVIIDGVTPGSLYNIHCWSTDAANSSGPELNSVAVTTVDMIGPYLTVTPVSAEDFNVTVGLELQDPGKAYPALSTCVARESMGLALPNQSQLSSKGQRCQYLQVPPTDSEAGRMPMMEVFRSRLDDQTTEVHIQQSQWGGPRQDYRTCGLRQEPHQGPGGCVSRASHRKASFVMTVRAYQDVHFFIGEPGQLGYEVLLGGWENTRVTLSRGHAREPANEDLGPPTALVTYSTPDQDPILDRVRFRTWWFDADPQTGLIRVGADEIIGHNILISYIDSSPLDHLNYVTVGAGYWSAGPQRNVFAEVYVCPRPGNLLQGRRIESSSYAFGGLAEKAVDGAWGDNTFCEYCAANDPVHVCASTRRQDNVNTPYFRIDLGDLLYRIRAIRLVVPTDGRPEQSADWSVFVGTAGSRQTDTLCTVIADATGDHIWPCSTAIQGSWVSVWGSVTQLRSLPEPFGMRICEIEAYATAFDTRFEDIVNKFDMAEGLPTPFSDNGTMHHVTIGGLQPNRSYEVFCYGEDDYGNQMYSQSAPVTFHTKDTTAPKVNIQHIYPSDLSITVEVSLMDPGQSYPAMARCMATTKDGKAPQEHERYFEHRFWRLRFDTRYTTLDRECADRILLRTVHLQSWGGETFRNAMFGSDPTYPQDQIGLDTDSDGLVDLVEIAQWSLPMEDAWVGIDLQHRPESERRVREQGVLFEGDLAVAIRWEGNVNDLDLAVIGPGDEYLEFNLTDGDYYRVSDFGVYAVQCNPGDNCPAPILSTMFVLAIAGKYDVQVYRRAAAAEPWADIQITATVRLCGEEMEYSAVLPADEHNDTIISGLSVGRQGCARQFRHMALFDQLRSWQSSARYGTAEEMVWFMGDTDETSCMETGGEGTSVTDSRPWWRMTLERTQLVQGLWLAGLPGPGVATMADVYVSSSDQQDVGTVISVDDYVGQTFYIFNDTTQYCYRVSVGQMVEEDTLSSSAACDATGFAPAASATYFLIGGYSSTVDNVQSYVNGVSCGAGQRHATLRAVIDASINSLVVTVGEVATCHYEVVLHIPLDDVLTQGTLCAQDVPIGNLQDAFNPALPIACIQESRGSTVWVVAKPEGKRLRLCEAEIFVEPLPTVTQVKFDYGDAGNETTGSVCGANNISVEFSDDNSTWLKAWDAFADGQLAQEIQTARWSWWQRLFALPFHANFSRAEAQNLTIPSLRENSTYDVLCWATDAVHNDIMQSMVMLPLPWADTRYEATTDTIDYPGARRLQGVDDETLKCSGWVRELMPCEEEIATSDKLQPSIAQATVAGIESTTEGFLAGTTERVTWQMELRDGSCSHRLGGVALCIVRCEIVEEDLSWLVQAPGDGCQYPRCSQKTWSNEYPVYLVFGQLRPAKEYTVRCLVMDPWGNAVMSDSKIWVPGHTTQSTSSTPTPTTQAPTPPPTTPAPTTTTVRATQPPVDYFTTRPPATTQGGGGGQTAPPTTRPPLIYTTSATPAPPTLPPTTTTTEEPTTTEPPTVPPWLVDFTPSGPVRTELSLSTSSREDAEELTFPTATYALLSALRLALGLGTSDMLVILGMDVYYQGDAGAGRRLSGRWLVRVRFEVTSPSQAQSRAIAQRVGELGLPGSSTASSFQEEFVQELMQSGSTVVPTVQAAKPLQDGESWSPLPSPSPPPSPSTTGPAVQTGGSTTEMSSEPVATGDMAWIVPVAITALALCICTLAGGVAYAMCYLQPESPANGKRSRVADSGQAESIVKRTASGNPVLLSDDLRESAKVDLQPAASTQPSVRAPRSGRSQIAAMPASSRSHGGSSGGSRHNSRVTPGRS